MKRVIEERIKDFSDKYQKLYYAKAILEVLRDLNEEEFEMSIENPEYFLDNHKEEVSEKIDSLIKQK